ncbi:FecR domain-containing protein [Steroidobacter sp. S1-65]|uniref:FecR domain-containing protein n=1 Tax=Steroidobacter gossypii TaxID=2805490 RepID=A0ABS1WV96_9GAMM|nr:FecR domain-containing protein [Steroidobacter gossypii]MBM0104889.1 FecR domain-containing protein [Steroidobacter gossypii]
MTEVNEEMLTVPEQAARWWRVMQDDEPSAGEKRAFAAWVAESPKHIEEMLRLAQIHRAFSRGQVRWPEDAAEALIRAAKTAGEDTVVPLWPPRSSRPEPTRRPVRVAAFGLAATVLLAVCVSWFALSRAESFETKIGEQRSVMLDDGSRITLNTASRIEVRLRPDRRVIDLVRGEALFEVAHDAQRPFDVRIDDTVARAVGTQFEVDRRDNRTVVTVVEGRVAVTSAAAAAPHLLSAGERITVDSTGLGAVEKGIKLDDATAWTRRQLVFRRRPLGEIAEEFNRYNAAQVHIQSDTLRKQEVSGIFRTDDVSSFVALLASKPGVRVVGDGSGGYVVTSDDSASPHR